uniref:Uncharacterized protein n=1 Tax=Tanacetum cinerariifolium TaxID=118510 RepID=A0A6L2KEJ1_TANCI|nr:hypothetical protein [Tanacetum cinerariifolium]
MVMMQQRDMGYCLLRNQEYRGGSPFQPPSTKIKCAQIESRANKRSIINLIGHNVKILSLNIIKFTGPYALSWKPCQEDSLNLPDHRYIADVAASFQRSQFHIIKLSMSNHCLGDCEGSGIIPKVLDELVFKSSNEGASVTVEVPDKPSDYSSSSSFDSKFKVNDISSDEAKDTKKVVNAKIVDFEKDIKDQDEAEEQEAQLEKPEATLISSAEFTSQFLNNNPHITVNDVLKDSIEPEVQLMVDVTVTQEKHVVPRPPLVDTTVTLIPGTTIISPTQPPQIQPKRRKTKVMLIKSNKHDLQVKSGELKCRVTRVENKVHAMSSFNLLEAIDMSMKAHLKNVLTKDVSNYGKIKLEKVKKSMPKNSSTPVDQAALDEFMERTDEILKLIDNLLLERRILRS